MKDMDKFWISSDDWKEQGGERAMLRAMSSL